MAASEFSVPRVLSRRATEDKAIFEMQYFEPLREPTDAELDDLMDLLHAAFNTITDTSTFPKHDMATVAKELATVTLYTDGELRDMDSALFNELFENTTINHGDWKPEQIIVHKDGYTIIDFGKPLVGPSIYDKTTITRSRPKLAQAVSDRVLLKGMALVDIRTIAWFDRCRRHYIDYNYASEIAAHLRSLTAIAQRLARP